ncbi:MAG TPA: hypothetical protein VJ376_18385 [Pseudomonadota bacterium]|nr:hypothetical protein [Pseudomonadota bacterium]
MARPSAPAPEHHDTRINAGTLAVGADANFGVTALGLAFGGGTLPGRIRERLSPEQRVHGRLRRHPWRQQLQPNHRLARGRRQRDAWSATFSGSGIGGLPKIGAGARTYSGGTTLAVGTLRLANNQALGTGALTTTGALELKRPRGRSRRSEGTPWRARTITPVYRRHHDQRRRTRPRQRRYQRVHRRQTWSPACPPSARSDTLSFGGAASGARAFMQIGPGAPRVLSAITA